MRERVALPRKHEWEEEEEERKRRGGGILLAEDPSLSFSLINVKKKACSCSGFFFDRWSESST